MSAPVSISTSAPQFDRLLRAVEGAAERCLAEIEPQRLPTPYALLELLRGDSRAAAWLASGDERREVLCFLEEEICELALPVLVDEGKNLLAAAAKFGLARDGAETAALAEKLARLAGSRYLDLLRTQIAPGFGFLTYPAYVLLNPRFLVRRFGKKPEDLFPFAYPVVFEMEGLRNAAGQPMPGWIAFLFLKPATLKEQVPLVREKTREGMRALAALNTRLAGLGGWLASLTDGGRCFGESLAPHVTTGHSYTITNILNTALEACRAVGLRFADATVAVVGAAGSVGSGVAKLAAAHGPSELVLIDHRSVQEVLAAVQQESSAPARAGSIAEDIGKAHVILVATTATGSPFQPGQFRPGALILDDSQPKNVSESFLAERDDILVLEAGAVQPPGGPYRIRPAFGPALGGFEWKRASLPMAGPDEVPCCLAEVMLWSQLGEERDQYSLGKADPSLARYLRQCGGKLGYQPGRLQAFGKAVPAERIARVRRVYGSQAG